MEKHQFECIANLFGLTPGERLDTSLANLNAIAIKGLHALPYRNGIIKKITHFVGLARFLRSAL